jgi:DNA-binding FadR family transcriptional regulator
MEPDAFGLANARFHERLVALAGNQTLAIVAQMLTEVVARAVTAVSKAGSMKDSASTRRRGMRSQERLVALLEAGKVSEAEAHWSTHMTIVGRLLLADGADTVIDLMHHD